MVGSAVPAARVGSGKELGARKLRPSAPTGELTEQPGKPLVAANSAATLDCCKKSRREKRFFINASAPYTGNFDPAIVRWRMCHPSGLRFYLP
jgi:hypothetical protein